MRVLCLLVSQAGKPVNREEIRRLLWGESTFVDYDVGMDYCVYRIRSVLGHKAQAPRYVETLPRRGYRFIAPVKRDLPFANLNRDPSKDYLADVVNDALITELARIPSVRVISRLFWPVASNTIPYHSSAACPTESVTPAATGRSLVAN